jgi:hypothetical protein
MLRRDKTVQFVPAGLFGTKRQLRVGKRLSNRVWKANQYQLLLTQQQGDPVAVCDDPDRGRTWWMFAGEFYWEDEGYSQREVKALILDRSNKKSKQVERAVAAMEGKQTSGARRERIPDSVQAVVWNRDGGSCIKCGSRERLEFDHIIPVSRGGANTARNLQLLCETCNRAKGGRVAG